jgi:hypothetical protein
MQFLRSTSSYGNLAPVVAAFMRWLRWTNYNLISSKSKLHEEAVSTYTRSLLAAKVRLNIRISFDAGNVLPADVLILRGSDVRVSMCISDVSDMRGIAALATLQGLSRGWAWIYGGGSLPDVLTDAEDGWMHVAPTSGFWMSSAEFTARRKDKAGWLNSSLPTVEPAPFMLHDAANLHDAVYLFARAADALLRQGTALNYRGALLKELKNTTFVGLSGRVTLDPQGDRVEQLGIINFAVRGKSHCHSAANCSGIVGLYDRQLEIFVPNLRYQPMWPGGTADPPSGLCPNQR